MNRMKLFIETVVWKRFPLQRKNKWNNTEHPNEVQSNNMSTVHLMLISKMMPPCMTNKIRTCFVNEWGIRSRTTFFGLQTFVNEEQFRKNMLETFLFLWFDCFSSYNLSKEIYNTKGSHKCLPCRRKIHCVVWTSYFFFYW